MAELSTGATFADHVIRGVAGRGGMGVVYRAMHLPLKREVALKVIAPGVSGDEEVRARFRREFEAAASIQHPNVVPIYHAGVEDGLLYVTMRYVDGTDLARLLAVEGRLEPVRAAVLIAQVGEPPPSVTALVPDAPERSTRWSGGRSPRTPARAIRRRATSGGPRSPPSAGARPTCVRRPERRWRPGAGCRCPRRSRARSGSAASSGARRR